MCLAANPDCVLLRLSWMYDRTALRPGEHGDFLRTMRNALTKGAACSRAAGLLAAREAYARKAFGLPEILDDREAFRDRPRNLCMDLTKLRAFGIGFPKTVDALAEALSEALSVAAV